MPNRASSPGALDRRLKFVVASLTVVALVALTVLRAYDLWGRRQLLLQEGERRAANIALILAAHVRAAFAAADSTLRQLAVYSGQVGGPGAPADKWNQMLGSSRTQRNGLGSVSVVDSGGIIRHSTVSTIVGNSRRDNGLFKRLSGSSRDLLTADTPFRAITNPELMLIPLGRRLLQEDGSFDGAVVATFTPARLREFFEQVDVGRQGHIWVFHPDGFVLFHVPASVDPIGESAVGNPLFERTREHSQARTLRLPAKGQDTSTITAFQPVGEPRLSIAVSLSEPELLATWRREVAVSSAIIAFLAVAFAAGLRFMFRQIDARATAEEALGRAQRLDAIGQLTGGVAHDFNNLLTVIMMNVSVLKLPGGAGEHGRPDAEPVDQIDNAARRAATLTQQLLTFARRQPLQPKLVDLNQLVSDIQPMLMRLLGEDVSLKLLLAEDTCAAEVDPVQVETALINLCINARDAMPQGGSLRIESGITTVDQADAQPNTDIASGRYVHVAVSDTGTGIAAEHLPRIFEPFFTTKPAGQGTGLGLSMVYGFVKQSGGHVKVHSETGHGTTVKLYFPLAAGVPPAAVRSLAPPVELQGNGETILLLEDEMVVRQVAEMMLTRLGYRVVSATNGCEALARAQAMTRIDLFLTDVILPGGMNGREVADELVRQRPGLRVLYASGYSEDILQRRSQLAPALHHIAKPYDMQRLAAAVRATLTADPDPIPDPAAPRTASS